MTLMMENTCHFEAQQRNYTLWHAGHIATTTFSMVLSELRETTALVPPVPIVQPPLLPVQPKYSYATTWLLCREGAGPGQPSKTASICCASPFDPTFVPHKLLLLRDPTLLLQSQSFNPFPSSNKINNILDH
eukprot:15366141-Ditylum_brightwellii.AAC.2